ncbi:MAG: PsbP-related protein [Candidatus Levybacteria bacterium]|nr:PsbP-related protein [Candidatus Levybacteria bacterium]
MIKNALNRKYLALLFIIIGFVFFVRPLINPEKPITIPQENTKETQYWKLYKNQEYHFSFKYPEGLLSNFQVNSTGKTTQTLKQLAFSKENIGEETDPNAYNVVFEADGWKFGDSIDKFLNSNLPETKNLKRQKIILGEISGVRIMNVTTKSDAYFTYNIFQNGNFIYNFAILSDDPLLIDGNSKLLENIISTVKF